MIYDLVYVKVPLFTGDVINDVKNLLLSNDLLQTFEHVRKVAKTNSEIASTYQLDKSICEVSGYLHDISAVIKPEDMLQFAKNENWYIDTSEERYPFILHQRISRVLAKELFEINDIRILNAIECHTTLKPNPSPYDMALFVADKLSWDQEGLPPFYQLLRVELEKSLEQASLLYMSYMVDNKMILYPHQWFINAIDFLKTKLL